MGDWEVKYSESKKKGSGKGSAGLGKKVAALMPEKALDGEMPSTWRSCSMWLSLEEIVVSEAAVSAYSQVLPRREHCLAVRREKRAQ